MSSKLHRFALRSIMEKKGGGCVACSKEWMAYVADQMRDAGDVTYRLMFGAYCVYLDGKPIGIGGDDQLFIKVTKAGGAVLPGLEQVPPYEGAKPHYVVECLDDRELLCRFVRATCDELPAPTRRKKHG